MGISTMQSYCSAQIFEALGLSQAGRRSTSPGRRRASRASALQEIYDEVLLRQARLPSLGDQRQGAAHRRRLSLAA
ncbi:MAG: glutamate synthase central domain-containing protein [Caldilineaceae bacterium]